MNIRLELLSILASIEDVDSRMARGEQRTPMARPEIAAARTILLGVMARVDALVADMPESARIPSKEDLQHIQEMLERDEDRRKNTELRETVDKVEAAAERDDFERFVRAIRADNPNGHGEQDDA